ncbi:MAG: helix-turn-helix domain-containing protein [Clostridiales bacterium]|nr:helix-turn-helix domain-containing protein [Clostridiales bacterium]
MKSFGDNLKNLRKLNKINQKDFAEKMGTTQQRVSEWECNKVEPSLYNVIKIIKVLGTSFDELTDGIYETIGE